jgi:hypothetical protein
MMKVFLKFGMPAGMMIGAAALGAVTITTNEATAGEYCRQDVTGHMTGCGFDTMEQCKAASAGVGGDCFRDPNMKDSRDAFAYHPNSSHLRRGARSHGNKANTNR